MQNLIDGKKDPNPHDSPRGHRAGAFGNTLIALYVLANIGAYVAFIPLLQILVPLQAVSIAPAQGAVLLSRVSLWGALAASVGNIVFGALSDRTRLRHGQRRPWLLGGLAAVLLSYAAIWRAASEAGLFAGVIGFQLAFNALFAPLGAVLADDVPAAKGGRVSAMLGLGYPIGSVIGAQLVGGIFSDSDARFAIMAMIVSVMILPFVWQLRHFHADAKPREPASQGRFHLRVLRNRDFSRALMGRLMVITAFSLIQGYLLLYLRHRAQGTHFLPGTAEHAFARLAIISTGANIASALAGGWWADRYHRRSPVVFTGGILLAGGIAAIAIAPSWIALQAAMAIYGCGAGIYYAVDLALIVQLLPSREHAGQDLGIVNLSNTLPQIAAPVIALILLRGGEADFKYLLLLGAAAATLGAATVLGIRA